MIAVFQEALVLFDGDVKEARGWMDSAARGLGSKPPLDMLGTRAETNAVLDLIHRLERGVLT